MCVVFFISVRQNVTNFKEMTKNTKNMPPVASRPMKRKKQPTESDGECEAKPRRKVTTTPKTLEPNELKPSVDNPSMSTCYLEIYNSIRLTHKILPTRGGYLFADKVIAERKYALAVIAAMDKARRLEKAQQEEKGAVPLSVTLSKSD